jgi:hypothetical protein
MAGTQQQQLRHELPPDLHPLLVEVNKAINESGGLITDLADLIGEKPGNFYGWLRGKGAPLFGPINAMLQQIGSRFVIVEAEGKSARHLREAVRNDPARIHANSRSRRRELPPGVDPIMVAVYDLFEDLDINRKQLCAAANISRGTLQRWMTPEGRPILLMLDGLLRQAGYRLKVKRGLVGPIIDAPGVTAQAEQVQV